MFAKAASNDMGKKKVLTKGGGDIFSDLQKKRTNPFANNSGSNKMMKKIK